MIPHKIPSADGPLFPRQISILMLRTLVSMAGLSFVAMLTGCPFSKTVSSPAAPHPETLKGVIYQGDSRSEVSVTGASGPLAKVTAVLIADTRLGAPRSQGESWRILAPRLKEVYPLCEEERFQDQLALGHCSGVLIGPSLVLTAGHCMSEKRACETTKFAFGWSLERSLNGRIGQEELYHCRRVVAIENESLKNHDFALVELDRPVAGVTPLPIAPERALADESELTSFSYPLGLPLKIDRAKVLEDDGEQIIFKAEVDTFSGSSGSPLIDGSGAVVGILIRGMPDFLEDDVYRVQTEGGCIRFNRCNEMSCFGETYLKPSRIPKLRDVL